MMVDDLFKVVFSPLDGEYMATCETYPGLSAFGETEAEALAEAKIARQLFIDFEAERNDNAYVHAGRA